MDERRCFGLDALRGGIMMLGVVLHGAMLCLKCEADPIYFPFAERTRHA
jgi:hypothetical protein